MNNISLITSWSSSYASLAGISWTPNKVRYAHKHGYGCMPIVHGDGMNAATTRIRGTWELMMQLPEGHWLLYSACDAMITNTDRKLEEFIPQDGFDFVCCMSYAFIFGDIWAVRVCDATKKMFDHMWNIQPWTCYDQQLFPAYLSKDPWEVFARKVGHNMLEESFYENCETLLSVAGVRTRCIRPEQRFAGDNPAIWAPRPIPMWEHEGGGCSGCAGSCPPELTWKPEWFMMHVGGVTLDFRLKYMSDFIKGIKW